MFLTEDQNPSWRKPAWPQRGYSVIGVSPKDFVEAWAEDQLECTGELDQVPEMFRSYFDVAAYARDLELNGDVFTVTTDSEVLVFWGR